MANEIAIQVQLQVNNTQSGGGIVSLSNPTAFKGNMAGNRGPSPGSLFVPFDGMTVSFTQLVLPNYATIANLDAVYDAHYGLWVPSVARAYPIHKLGPKEIYPCRFSEFLGEDFHGGVGTGSADAVLLWVKAMNPAGQSVVFNAFET